MTFNFDAWQAGGGKGSPLPFDRSCFAGYWDAVPSPVAKGEGGGIRLEVDGFSFLGRMSAYKFLVEQTNPEVWGPDRSGHLLWGYAALLDWQARSGRLGTTSGIDEEKRNDPVPPDVVSPRSWWGYMNFLFSICVLIGAAEADALDCGAVEVALADARSRDLVEGDPVVREAIRRWRGFWTEGFVPYSRGVAELLRDESLSERRRSERIDALYDEMNRRDWEDHCAIFRIAVFDKGGGEASRMLLAELDEPERKFAVGFCKIVRILAAVNVRTDLIATSENGVGYLPLRMVDDAMMEDVRDGAGSDEKLSPSPIRRKRNATVANMHGLYDASEAATKAAETAWRRVGRWKHPRKNVGTIFHDLTHGDGPAKAVASAKFAFFLVLPASAAECAAWLAVAAAAWSRSRARASEGP